MSCSSQPQVHQNSQLFRKACGTTTRCPCKQTGFRYSNRCCTGNESSVPCTEDPHSIDDQLTAVSNALSLISREDFQTKGTSVELNVYDIPLIESMILSDGGVSVTLQLTKVGLCGVHLSVRRGNAENLPVIGSNLEIIAPEGTVNFPDSPGSTSVDFLNF